MRNQSGYSAIAMVMILCLLGIMMLNAFNTQLMILRKTHVDERQYLLAYNQAISALEWGTISNWQQPTPQWQCQQHITERLKVCLKLSEDPQRAILKGEGIPATISLYRIVLFEVGSGKLQWLKQGWLDFCPEKEENFCD